MRANFYQTVTSLTILTSLFAITSCASQPKEPVPNLKIVFNSKGVPNYHQVKSGDTVGSIAKKYNLDYRNIGKINQLNDNYDIEVGQALKLWSNQAKFEKNVAKKPEIKQKVVTYKPTYQYPSKNQVLKHYKEKGSNGVWFEGKANDPVYAAQSGQVIYAGEQLQEYGNLIIIHHGENLTSTYAHNDKILVKEGDIVDGGNKIARMGDSGRFNKVLLEFQMRQQGVAVDPNTLIR